MSNTETLINIIEQKKPLSPAVRAAFMAVDRACFVSQYYEHQGKQWMLQDVTPEALYQDRALVTQVQDGMSTSSSSAPGVMASMLEALDLQPGQRVLEIGTGTGYNAALLGHIVGASGLVVSVDIDPSLAETARQHLAAIGLDRIQIYSADGLQGYPSAAPYDRIIATGGFRRVPLAWKEQLMPGGILVGNLLGNLANVLLYLVKQHDGSLQGRLLQGAFFMELRGPDYAVQPFDWAPYEALSVTEHHVSMDVSALLRDHFFLFYLQSVMPSAKMQMHYNGGPLNEKSSYEQWLVNGEGCLMSKGSEPGSWMVIERGQERLWERLHFAYQQWWRNPVRNVVVDTLGNVHIL